MAGLLFKVLVTVGDPAEPLLVYARDDVETADPDQDQEALLLSAAGRVMDALDEAKESLGKQSSAIAREMR